ncbi:uncharacterized protein LACBIDRAFT_332405 [Laccaria bicolor S238N-H82]|uniref:Predicted protein n=1 Tax=Laccaria bicolor (strain S238N-H82 / ATCC MYA-4686) TaxID=486041 RepID=B0DSM1_LACBS|nr:uncharacterized protein LACBIDRAFT_332405 [Laccaria bicolor S238N-H82]EDR02344.1 predicted protein [Laccaria bicolor S238N-H82]|eukprot:XP_001887021.1 predicted protein [Laccaria bicolor S238N-H82]
MPRPCFELSLFGGQARNTLDPGGAPFASRVTTSCICSWRRYCLRIADSSEENGFRPGVGGRGRRVCNKGMSGVTGMFGGSGLTNYRREGKGGKAAQTNCKDLKDYTCPAKSANPDEPLTIFRACLYLCRDRVSRLTTTHSYLSVPRSTLRLGPPNSVDDYLNQRPVTLFSSLLSLSLAPGIFLPLAATGPVERTSALRLRKCLVMQPNCWLCSYLKAMFRIESVWWSRWHALCEPSHDLMYLLLAQHPPSSSPSTAPLYCLRIADSSEENGFRPGVGGRGQQVCNKGMSGVTGMFGGSGLTNYRREGKGGKAAQTNCKDLKDYMCPAKSANPDEPLTIFRACLYLCRDHVSCLTATHLVVTQVGAGTQLGADANNTAQISSGRNTSGHRYQSKRPPGPVFYTGKYEKTTRGYVQKIKYFTPDSLLHAPSAPAQHSQQAQFDHDVDTMVIDEFAVPFHQRTSGKSQNDYLREWVARRDKHLEVTLVTEAPPPGMYHVNLWDRIANNPNLSISEKANLIMGIGLFHVHGHQDECLFRLATSFIPGAGMVDGEILESLWAQLNDISRSTRTATLAHRAEVLDDHMNDSNWNKMVNIVSSVIAKYRKAVVGLVDSKDYFDQLNSSAGEHNHTWQAEIRAAESDRAQGNLKAMDIMAPRNPPNCPAPLTTAQVQLKLMDQERLSMGSTGQTSWIATGLKIEETQIELRFLIRRTGKKPTMLQKVDIAKRRERLRVRIDAFNKTGMTFLAWNPALNENQLLLREEFDMDDVLQMDDDLAESNFSGSAPDIMVVAATKVAQAQAAALAAAEAVEHVKLALPSAMGEEHLQAHGLQHFLSKEYQLCQGQANDALQGVRVSLANLSFEYGRKLRKIKKSKVKKTRAWATVHAVGRTLHHHRQIYSYAIDAISRLGDPEKKIGRQYKPLLKEDMKANTAVADPNARGQSRAKPAWFWSSNLAGDMQDNEQMVECKASLYPPQ